MASIVLCNWERIETVYKSKIKIVKKKTNIVIETKVTNYKPKLLKSLEKQECYNVFNVLYFLKFQPII